MGLFTFVAIVAVAGIVFDYLKTREKYKSQFNTNNGQLNDLELEINSLKKRIKNLEAIVANDDTFSNSNKINLDFDENEWASNQDKVNQMAAKRKGSKI